MATLTTKPTECYIKYYTCMQDRSLQSCLTLCSPTDCSPPGFSVRGISQARVMEWGCPFLLQEIFQLRDQTHISCTCRFLTKKSLGSLIYSICENERKRKNREIPLNSSPTFSPWIHFAQLQQNITTRKLAVTPVILFWGTLRVTSCTFQNIKMRNFCIKKKN